ncbi:ferritin-like domain-containing protein [uncultured Roseobacter sp.]|uniref:ferritin-like domain-containing protein n=1 Tax=uncultured Roseobacter sp. TaxID=114847 RepID=UPI0026142C2B|nr:ferritin-like domain-containing protein [uncultured Roseobacter sp.]
MLRRKGKYAFAARSKPETVLFSFDAKSLTSFDAAIAEFAAESSEDLVLRRQDPPVLLRDEIIFLLHTAAEIEHALMAQYLYSAFSLPKTGAQGDWRRQLILIAKEEMGHLMAVQNILSAIGGVLNFEREDYPFNIFYPFPFKLEPFSVSAVARYVLAEMPDPTTIPDEIGFSLEEVRSDAGLAPGAGNVNRVGLLFELLLELIGEADEDLLIAGAEVYQGDPGAWRAGINGLVLNKVSTKAEVLKMVDEIAEQGEGVSLPGTPGVSHFERLFEIYKAAKAAPGPLSLPVPTDPTVHEPSAEGYIENPEARLWADVFNHRFRWTLASVGSHLFLPEGQDRATLAQWAFEDMFLLSEIAEHLVELPRDTDGTKDDEGRNLVAAGPFELPYTLALPDRPRLIWLHQEMLHAQSMEQMKKVTIPNPLSLKIGFLDGRRATFIEQVLNQIG